MKPQEYTKEQYVKMSSKFNKLSFIEKIKVIKNNQDILAIGMDLNWCVVRVLDKEVEDYLHDTAQMFDIENEWQDNHIRDLLELLNIKVLDV